MPPEVRTAWNRFAAEDSKRPAGLDVYPDIFKDGWLFPLQRMRETAVMMARVRSNEPKIIMEIGTDKGGGFYHWLKGIPSVKEAIAIEIRGCPFAEPFRRMFPDVRLNCIEASSFEPMIVEGVAHWLQGFPIDMLFIDGEKSHIAKDFNAYRPLIRPGGLILIHDITDRHIPPSQFFFSLPDEKSIIYDGSEGEEAAAREASGVPIDCSYEQWLRIWKGTSCGVGVVQC